MAEASEVWHALVEKIRSRADDYQKYHEFWRGEQDLPITSTEFQSRFGTLFENYRNNLSRPIIKTAESRIRIVGFGDGEGLGKSAQELWDDNDMNLKSQHVHVEALVKGDGYVIVLPRSDGSPGIWPQISESCSILYDEVMPDDKIAAMKWWVLEPGDTKTDKKVRVNIYFEDRIERYVSKSATSTLDNNFQTYEKWTTEPDSIDGDVPGWSTPHKVGEVPMFELNANYDIADGWGRSDLADATGPIDAINKTILDMLTASEFTAEPQRFATGVEIPIDPQTGDPLETYKAGKQKLWTAPNEQARFGQFGAGDLSSYSDAVALLVDQLTFTTATPSYAMMKSEEFPSGEALRSAEAPLRGRVSDHQDAFGPVWHAVIIAALGIGDSTAEIEGVTRKDVKPEWLPVNAPFATVEFMEELKVKAETLGVPEEKLWQEAGYTADEITEMKAMREEEAELGIPEDPFAQQAGELLEGAPGAGEEVGGVAIDTLPAAPEEPAA
jgi:hypothetical protein